MWRQCGDDGCVAHCPFPPHAVDFSQLVPTGLLHNKGGKAWDMLGATLIHSSGAHWREMHSRLAPSYVYKRPAATLFGKFLSQLDRSLAHP